MKKLQSTKEKGQDQKTGQQGKTISQTFKYVLIDIFREIYWINRTRVNKPGIYANRDQAILLLAKLQEN